MKTRIALFTIVFSFVGYGFAASQMDNGMPDWSPTGFFEPTFPENLYEYAYMFGQGNYIQFPSVDVREKIAKSVRHASVATFDDQDGLLFVSVFIDTMTDRIILNGLDRTQKGTIFIALQNELNVDLAYATIPLLSDSKVERLSEIMAIAIPARPLVAIVFPWWIQDGYGKEWKIIVSNLNGQPMNYEIDAMYDWDSGAIISNQLFQTTPNPYKLGLDQKINLEVALGAYVQGPTTNIYNATGEVIGGCGGGGFNMVTPPNFNVTIKLEDTLGGELVLANMPSEPAAQPTPTNFPPYIEVEKNTAMADGSSDHPTGMVNQTNVKIASFVIIGGGGEATQISQIVLQDMSTTYYASYYFRNLKLMHNTDQFGSTIGKPQDGATMVQTHTFQTPAIIINPGERYVVDVYADIKNQPLLGAAPILGVFYVTGKGVVSKTPSNWSDEKGLTLQGQCIAPELKLTAAWSPDSPQGMVAPSIETVVAKIVLANPQNVGDYAVIVSFMNFGISVTNFDASNDRVLKIYKDTPNSVPVAIHTWKAGQPLSDTTIAESEFTDVDIASNSIKTFFVTINTIGAKIGSKLSISVSGITAVNSLTGTMAPVDGLPLLPKTLEF